ncbi:MAG: hypothetical protein BWY61_00418 [Firmicutes bacterium ADurb.Bin354]|nr:MAG: hypothetical protein BWY61_00418 [Firmicutes bacterium ADurb.Bin354]
MKVHAFIFQTCHCLYGVFRMLPVYHPSGPEYLCTIRHSLLFHQFINVILYAFRKISPHILLVRVGTDKRKIRCNISTCAQKIIGIVLESYMIMILFLKSRRGNELPLPLFVYPFVISECKPAGFKPGHNIVLIINSSEYHGIGIHYHRFRFFRIIGIFFHIRNIRSIDPPAHADTLGIHLFDLEKCIINPFRPGQSIGQRLLMMIEIVGCKYKFHYLKYLYPFATVSDGAADMGPS